MNKMSEYGETLEREIENQAKKLTTLEERTSKKYKQGFVYDYLKTSIITGRLPPEKQLIEREICDKLGVSRTPVREAFRQLSSEGLVDFLPGCGVVVSAMTKEKAEELYQLKEALECMAARLCAERAPEEHIKKMYDCISHHRQAYIDVEPLAAVDLDLQFHVLILEGAQSPMIEQRARELLLQTRRLSQLAVYDQDKTPDFLAQHEAILNAICEHRPDAAAAAVSEHIKYVKEFQWKRWNMLF